MKGDQKYWFVVVKVAKKILSGTKMLVNEISK